MRYHELQPLLEMIVRTPRIDRGYVLAYRDSIWLLPFDASEDSLDEKTLDEITRIVPGVADDGLDDTLQEPPVDVFVGHLSDGDITLASGGFHHPTTSVLIKKVVAALGIDTVSSNQMQGDEDVDQTYYPYQMKGERPEFLYHGTSSAHLTNILRHGLRPNMGSNWLHNDISHDDLIFGAATDDLAVFHANRTAKTDERGEREYGDPFPVVIKFKVPDPALLTIDYDMAARVGLDVKGYGDQPHFHRHGPKHPVPQRHDWAREGGVFAYEGRVPASHIVQIMTAFHEVPLTSNNAEYLSPKSYLARLKEIEDELNGYDEDWDPDEDDENY